MVLNLKVVHTGSIYKGSSEFCKSCYKDSVRVLQGLVLLSSILGGSADSVISSVIVSRTQTEMIGVGFRGSFKGSFKGFL